MLLARQLKAVELLKQHGITVKVNSIMIPGVNDHHVPVLAAKMKELGVDLLNCMAMFPNVDTAFENIAEPGKEMMERLRSEAEQFLPQMRHCTRCRADAVGLLDQDRTDEMRGCLSACAALPKPEESHAALTWPWPRWRVSWSISIWVRQAVFRSGERMAREVIGTSKTVKPRRMAAAVNAGSISAASFLTAGPSWSTIWVTRPGRC